MFICQHCKSQVSAREPSFLFTAKTRDKIYPSRASVNKYRQEHKIKNTDDPGGVGVETVEEKQVCKLCYHALKQLESSNGPLSAKNN
ncbi:hypothetical protein [Zooshikella harenae]|uniref:Uncharacterized protein n=1 Tax=Zooshikella harenae TaxID=2827238 RepID=A0ABS5ZG77_9GAMM|nr:hypothetical protein [Zooshikella harenae]MBU2712990.1 hypothetical protein [Zooshikella harenae]